MKTALRTKLYAALVAGVALAGLLNAAPQVAVAEPGCKGSGQLCAVAPDGTLYVKGDDQVTE